MPRKKIKSKAAEGVPPAAVPVDSGQTEAALRESEERYRLLFDNASDGVTLLEVPAGGMPVILNANAAALRMHGYKLDELVGKPITILDAELPEPEQTRERLSMSKGAEGMVFETRHRRKDGTVFDVEISIKHILLGDRHTLIDITRDVSSRKRLEQMQRIQHELVVELNSCSNLRAGLDKVLNAVLQLEYVDCGGIYLADPMDNSIELMVHRGMSAEFVKQVSRFPGDSPQVSLLLSGTARYGIYPELLLKMPEVRRNDRFRAYAVIPIMSSGRLIAVLNLASRSHDSIPAEVRSSLETIAYHAGGMLLRLRVHAALSDSEERHRTLVESSPDAVWICDENLRFVYVNRTTAQWVGLSAAEAVGRRFTELFRSGMAGEQEKLLRGIFASGNAFEHDMFLMTDLRGMWQNVRIIPSFDADGRVAALVGILRDITGRKLAEDALKQATGRYRDLILSLHDVVFMMNTGGTVEYASPQAERVMGYPPPEIEGHHFSEFIVPEDRAAVKAAFLDAVGGNAYASRYRILRKDGSLCWVRSSRRTVKSEDGRVVGVNVLLSDIDEQVAMQKALDEISAREREKLRLDLHDGVCQQLTGIGFLAKKLGMELSKASRPEAVLAKEIGVIACDTAGMAHDVAAGLMPLPAQPSALSAALKDLALRVGRMSGIRCRTAIARNALISDCDAANQLYLIAQEAVANAVRHSGCREVTIELARHGREFVLSVHDDGKGFGAGSGDRPGMGLHIMQSRAKLARASLDVTLGTESGTVVRCVWVSPEPTPDEVTG